MTTFREKIDKLLIINGKNIRTIGDLEAFCEIGDKTIRKAYTENREPTPKTLGKIFTKLELDSEAWNAGSVKLFKENVTLVGKEETTVKQVFLNQNDGKKDDDRNKRVFIPFFDTMAVGGTSLLAEQDPVYGYNAEMIDPGTWFKGASGALRVYGHSMFPKYPAGCIVAFKESEKDLLLWGEDYVIELSDRRILKRVEKGGSATIISAVSYNKSEEYPYAPIDIPVEKIKRIFMVLGKVELEASV